MRPSLCFGCTTKEFLQPFCGDGGRGHGNPLCSPRQPTILEEHRKRSSDLNLQLASQTDGHTVIKETLLVRRDQFEELEAMVGLPSFNGETTNFPTGSVSKRRTVASISRHGYEDMEDATTTIARLDHAASKLLASVRSSVTFWATGSPMPMG